MLKWMSLLREIRFEGVRWIHLAQDRGRWPAIGNTVVHLRIPSKAGNLTSWATVSFSRRTPLLEVSYDLFRSTSTDDKKTKDTTAAVATKLPPAPAVANSSWSADELKYINGG
jgi:hypothetical protein